MAERLRDSVRATDSVLRIGGDEFIVVMPDVVEDLDILRSAAKMLTALGREGPPGFERLNLPCSLGVAIYPILARSVADLIARADAAMYRAKFRGGNCYEVCSGEVLGTYPPTILPFPLRKPREGNGKGAKILGGMVPAVWVMRRVPGSV